MASTTQKSPAYYTIIVCLAIMGAAMLWGLLWQPSFAQGSISIPFRQGYLVFSLWTFAPAVLSLGLFLYYTTQTVRQRYQGRPLVFAMLSGVTFLTLSFFLSAAFGYIWPSSGNPDTQDTYSHYASILLLVRVSVVLALLVLLYQWRKRGRYRDVA